MNATVIASALDALVLEAGKLTVLDAYNDEYGCIDFELEIAPNDGEPFEAMLSWQRGEGYEPSAYSGAGAYFNTGDGERILAALTPVDEDGEATDSVEDEISSYLNEVRCEMGLRLLPIDANGYGISAPDPSDTGEYRVVLLRGLGCGSTYIVGTRTLILSSEPYDACSAAQWEPEAYDSVKEAQAAAAHLMWDGGRWMGDAAEYVLLATEVDGANGADPADNALEVQVVIADDSDDSGVSPCEVLSAYRVGAVRWCGELDADDMREQASVIAESEGYTVVEDGYCELAVSDDGWQVVRIEVEAED